MLGRRIFIGLLAALIAFSFATVGCVYWLFNVEMPRVMSDFAAIWNSTDALTHYVQTKNEWPHDWNQLDSSLRVVAPSCDLAFYEDQININFDIDLKSALPERAWFVRLRSGRMQPEVDRANQRIRRFIESCQTKLIDEAQPDNLRQS